MGVCSSATLFPIYASANKRLISPLRKSRTHVQVVAPGLPLRSDYPRQGCLNVELHTTSHIHRIVLDFWPRRGYFKGDSMQPQAAETIAAAINQHISRRAAQRGRDCGSYAAAAQSEGPHLCMATGVPYNKHVSAYTPLLATGPPKTSSAEGGASGADAAGANALGQPAQQLKEVQATAIRATNFQRPDGRWVSSELPPRRSALVNVLSRGHGQLHMRLPTPTGEMHSRIGTAILLILLTAVSNLSLIFNFVAARTGQWPGNTVYFAARVACTCLGALGIALTYKAQRQAHLDVWIGRGGYSVVRVPWWLPVTAAVPISRWLPFYPATHGRAEDLSGAEVCPHRSCMHSVHVRQSSHRSILP